MNNFEKAYKLLKDNVKCPSDCHLCEELGMIFLPGEFEFLVKKNLIKKEERKKFAKIYHYKGYRIHAFLMEEEEDCPFFNKIEGCLKREARPLDCRSYPAIPVFKNNKIYIRFDKKCPLVANKKSLKISEEGHVRLGAWSTHHLGGEIFLI